MYYENVGKKIVELLQLKPKRESGFFKTSWGGKTPEGLARSIEKIIEDHKEPFTKAEHKRLHKKMHKSLDILLADWIDETDHKTKIDECKLLEFLQSASDQKTNPSDRNKREIENNNMPKG